MKTFELLVDGYHTPLTAAQIAEHFAAGMLSKCDACRQAGSDQWRTVDELFPLLKYSPTALHPVGGSITADSSFDVRDGHGDDILLPAATSALKAGWVCFGLGLAISWFFPLGHIFFSVGLVTAVVAMCTHQVNRGLVLLISSFCGSMLCALVFFSLVVGTVAVAGGAAMQKVNADLQRSQAAQQQSINQINAASAQMQRSFQTLTQPTYSAPATTFKAPVSQFHPPTPVPQQKTTADAVRQAELQRDQINAKQQRLDQLQRSIDNLDSLIQQSGGSSSGNSFLVKQREQLADEKWQLQH